jgi:NADH:ubiquinone oxidoreductase subunit 5 (subunit L)/multisubunit Na+/H+ antiporter MnhA subunit
MGLTGAAFVFLLSVLGVCVPLILIASRTKSARNLAIALILVASLAGCAAAVFGFLRQSPSLLNLSRVTPFPFLLAIDRLSAFFLLLVCVVAIPVTIFAVPYLDLH